MLFRSKPPVCFGKQLSQVSVWQSHTKPEWQPADCPAVHVNRGEMSDSCPDHVENTYTPVRAANELQEDQRCGEKRSSDSVKSASSVENYSMKFARPRKLLINEYPDVNISHPDMIRHMCQQVIFPESNSDLDKYLNTTITYLKKQKSDRVKKAQEKITRVNLVELGRNLYFVMCKCSNKSVGKQQHVKALVDTGAANSLIHTSVINNLGIGYKPLKLTLATATGLDDNAVKGIAHMTFVLRTTDNKEIRCCTNFIVTSRLNELQCIIGAEFLMDRKEVTAISKDKITLQHDKNTYSIGIFPDKEPDLPQGYTEDTLHVDIVDMTCRGCGNKKGPKREHVKIGAPLEIRHSYWHGYTSAGVDITSTQPGYTSAEVDNTTAHVTDMSDHVNQTSAEVDTTTAHNGYMSDNVTNTSANVDILDTKNRITAANMSQIHDTGNVVCNSTLHGHTVHVSHDNDDVKKLNDCLEERNRVLRVMSHTVKQLFENETLPSSEEFFDTSEELKFEILDKQITLDDADYSECPPEHYPKLRQLLDDYKDRFSRYKLDLEVTDMYEAELETKPGKKVIQKVRPLSSHKFDFALKAVRQLERAGVVRESDSPWRSKIGRAHV